MNEITITISGPNGSGKSTLAKLFTEWLVHNNFDVQNTDSGNENDTEEYFLQRMRAISEKSKIKIKTPMGYHSVSLDGQVLISGSSGSGTSYWNGTASSSTPEWSYIADGTGTNVNIGD